MEATSIYLCQLQKFSDNLIGSFRNNFEALLKFWAADYIFEFIYKRFTREQFSVSLRNNVNRAARTNNQR
jgi:hypothetical protein